MNKPLAAFLLQPSSDDFAALLKRTASPLNPAIDDGAETAAERQGARVGISRPHESAHLHVAGEAAYIDDLPELNGTLHAALGLSPVAHGRLTGMALDRIRALPGVVLVLSAASPASTTAARSSTTSRSCRTANCATSASRCSR